MLFTDGDARIVRRESTELCLAVCLSRDPLSMLLKLIRTLVLAINELAGGCSLLRVLLQTDEQLMRGTSEYIFDARFESEPRRLEIDIMKNWSSKVTRGMLIYRTLLAEIYTKRM